MASSEDDQPCPRLNPDTTPAPPSEQRNASNASRVEETATVRIDNIRPCTSSEYSDVNASASRMVNGLVTSYPDGAGRDVVVTFSRPVTQLRLLPQCFCGTVVGETVSLSSRKSVGLQRPKDNASNKSQTSAHKQTISSVKDGSKKSNSPFTPPSSKSAKLSPASMQNHSKKVSSTDTRELKSKDSTVSSNLTQTQSCGFSDVSKSSGVTIVRIMSQNLHTLRIDPPPDQGCVTDEGRVTAGSKTTRLNQTHKSNVSSKSKESSQVHVSSRTETGAKSAVKRSDAVPSPLARFPGKAKSPVVLSPRRRRAKSRSVARSRVKYHSRSPSRSRWTSGSRSASRSTWSSRSRSSSASWSPSLSRWSSRSRSRTRSRSGTRSEASSRCSSCGRYTRERNKKAGSQTPSSSSYRHPAAKRRKRSRSRSLTASSSSRRSTPKRRERSDSRSSSRLAFRDSSTKRRKQAKARSSSWKRGGKCGKRSRSKSSKRRKHKKRSRESSSSDSSSKEPIVRARRRSLLRATRDSISKESTHRHKRKAVTHRKKHEMKLYTRRDSTPSIPRSPRKANFKLKSSSPRRRKKGPSSQRSARSAKSKLSSASPHSVQKEVVASRSILKQAFVSHSAENHTLPSSSAEKQSSASHCVQKKLALSPKSPSPFVFGFEESSPMSVDLPALSINGFMRSPFNAGRPKSGSPSQSPSKQNLSLSTSVSLRKDEPRTSPPTETPGRPPERTTKGQRKRKLSPASISSPSRQSSPRRLRSRKKARSKSPSGADTPGEFPGLPRSRRKARSKSPNSQLTGQKPSKVPRKRRRRIQSPNPSGDESAYVKPKRKYVRKNARKLTAPEEKASGVASLIARPVSGTGRAGGKPATHKVTRTKVEKADVGKRRRRKPARAADAGRKAPASKSGIGKSRQGSSGPSEKKKRGRPAGKKSAKTKTTRQTATTKRSRKPSKKLAGEQGTQVGKTSGKVITGQGPPFRKTSKKLAGDQGKLSGKGTVSHSLPSRKTSGRVAASRGPPSSNSPGKLAIDKDLHSIKPSRRVSGHQELSGKLSGKVSASQGPSSRNLFVRKTRSKEASSPVSNSRQAARCARAAKPTLSAAAARQKGGKSSSLPISCPKQSRKLCGKNKTSNAEESEESNLSFEAIKQLCREVGVGDDFDICTYIKRLWRERSDNLIHLQMSNEAVDYLNGCLALIFQRICQQAVLQMKETGSKTLEWWFLREAIEDLIPNSQSHVYNMREEGKKILYRYNAASGGGGKRRTKSAR